MDYMDYELEMALESLDAAIEASSFEYKRIITNLKQKFEGAGDAGKSFNKTMHEVIQKKDKKRGLELCTEHLGLIQDAHGAINEAVQGGYVGAFFEAFAAVLLSYILVGLPWVVRIAKYQNKMSIYASSLTYRKKKVEEMRKAIRSGDWGEAEDALSDIENMKLDDVTKKDNIWSA